MYVDREAAAAANSAMRASSAAKKPRQGKRPYEEDGDYEDEQDDEDATEAAAAAAPPVDTEQVRAVLARLQLGTSSSHFIVAVVVPLVVRSIHYRNRVSSI